MPYQFVDNTMNNIITKLINDEFPNMNTTDINIVKKYFTALVEVISHNFDLFDDPLLKHSNRTVLINKNEFIKDNNLNLRWLLTYILPFINTNNGFTMKDIKSLNEIYVKKKENVDIDKKSPQYVYSNIQYGRCNRNNKKKIKEIQFAEKHIRDNYYLLIYTLRECKNKMHVNWKDIMPYTLKSYKKSKLYNDTLNKKRNKKLLEWDIYDVCDPDKLKLENNINNLEELTNGLYVGVIYDTVSNLLYESILSVKWMIYDVPILKSSLEPSGKIPMIMLISRYLNLAQLSIQTNVIYWEDVNELKKKQFIDNWNRIVDAVTKNIIISIPEHTLTLKDFIFMIKNLMIGFTHYNKKAEYAKAHGYIPFEYDEETNHIDNDSFLRAINTLKAEYLYNYLVDCMHKFKKTWYSLRITGTDKQGYNMDYEVGVTKADGYDIYITSKNVYNFCKSLVHYINSDRKFTRMPKYWKSLNNDHKQLFINRINGLSDNNWFNISRYIKAYIRETSVSSINNAIYNYVIKIFIPIIFETLVTNGILTYFKPTYSDDINLEKTFEQSPNNELWTDSFHYLTDRSYRDTGTFKFDMNGETREINVFTYNKRSQWYTRISMHWIAQFGLCHRIVHQRVHFITGGTGIGKSSVVPILYMYYLKSLNYNLYGSVVCTQPRIQPTKDTAKNTSSQLGLPITADFKEYNDNYNIQMVYKGTRHTSDVELLKLKFSTDGSLIMDLNNPMLKQPKNVYSDRYTTENLYDVVIIDEAHEHNTNMDIILSFMRNIVHYNNSVTLVIMSATIDDDEPVYRRYYRDVNDNRKYPLDRFIEQHSIDRVNIDRRLHIAKPGSDTRHHIDDKYVDGSDPDKLTAKIMNTTHEGYALLFRPGQAEINKSIEYINQNTPPNVIALPFYAKLEDNVRKFIEKIDGNLSKLKINKPLNVDDINLAGREDRLTIGTNIYNRCVIVATNIAEASITINKLKYVIETGKQKKSIYNYQVRSSILKSVGISESSRLQRRGRVGRTSSGQTFYTYKEGAMKNNKFLFNISISDLTMDILNYMRESDKEQAFIDIDVNSNSLTLDNVNRLNNGYDKIIKSQYFIDNKPYEYIGNMDDYDYQNYENCAIYYESGYKYSDVIDLTGKFYIIHPDELSFNRNLNGEIVEALNDNVNIIKFNNKLNKIKSKKIFSFLDNLLKNMLITFKDKHTVKTTVGKYIYSLSNSLQQSESIDSLYDVLLLMYSYVFDCSDLIIRYIAFKNAINGNLKNILLYSKEKYRFTKDKVQNILQNKSSDVVALIEISFIIDKILADGKLTSNTLTLNQMDNKYIRTFGNNSKSIIEDILNIKNNEIKARGYDVKYNDYVSNLYENIKNDIKNKLEISCTKLGLKHEKVERYCKNYIMLNKDIIMLKIKKSRRDTVTLKELADILKPLKGVLREFTSSESISFCLLLSKPYNLVKFINGTQNKYLDVFNPTLLNIKSYASLDSSRFIPNTLSKDMNLKSYMYYDNYDINSNEISLMHKISPNSLTITSHIYTLFDIKSRYDKSHDGSYEMDNIKANLNYTKAFNGIYSDLLKRKSLLIWNILPQIDSSLSEYCKMMKKYDKYGTSREFNNIY